MTIRNNFRTVLFISPIANVINSDQSSQISIVSFHQYADDIQLYIGTNSSTLTSQIASIESCSQRVHDWLLNNGLHLNPSKSEANRLIQTSCCFGDWNSLGCGLSYQASSSSSHGQLAVGASRERPPHFSVHCHPNHFTQIHLAPNSFSDVIYPSSWWSSSGSASLHHAKCNHLQHPVISHSCHMSKQFELSGFYNVHHG